MSDTSIPHISVLPEEVSHYLQPRENGRYVDGTLGAGGHAIALLQTHLSIEVIGIDRDAAALLVAKQRLAPFAPRVHFSHGSYSDMARCVREAGWSQVDGILLDLGLSSMQIDTPLRGFSFQKDGPLDMRFDSRSPVTASSLLNSASESELARILHEYGDEPSSRRIARGLVERRATRPWDRTLELAEFLKHFSHPNPSKQHQLMARCFQGLRIAVNDELRQVADGLRSAIELLAPGGRLVVISFHSLEDRIVKQTFKDLSQTYIRVPEHPMGGYDVQPVLEVLTKRPIRPSDEELARNSRSAPSRLRAAMKV